MNNLPSPDSHHVEAAKGWLELQVFEEAAREIEATSPSVRDHPAVLEVRWALAANSGNWPEALALAISITQQMPNTAEGWIYQGSALAELGRHEDAYAALLQGHHRCPDDEIVVYDLACVCCTLRRDDEAADWLRKAIGIAGDEVRARALEDPDLERMRDWLITDT